MLISPLSFPPFVAIPVFLAPFFGLLGLLPPSSLKLFDVPELAKTLDGRFGTLLGGGIAIDADDAVLETTRGAAMVGLRDIAVYACMYRVG